jgi:hypothetical protein
MTKCRLPGCETTKLHRFGLCNKHRKWVEKGVMTEDLRLLRPLRGSIEYCKLMLCREPHRSHGFCKKHLRWFKTGILDANGKKLREPKPERNPPGAECKVWHERGKITKGFCRRHYEQLSRGQIDIAGKVLIPLKRVSAYRASDECKAERCTKTPRIRGWCECCYRSFEKGYFNAAGKRIAPWIFKNKGKTCTAAGCEREAHIKGLCTLHHSRVQKGYVGPEGMKNKGKWCSMVGCGKPAHCRTLCSSHYRIELRAERYEAEISGSNAPTQPSYSPAPEPAPASLRSDPR